MLPRKTEILSEDSALKRNRTLIILGSAVALSLLLLLFPIASIFIRLVFSILLLGAATLLAFWRVQGAVPLEQYVWTWLKFKWRERDFLLGGYQRKNEAPIHFSDNPTPTALPEEKDWAAELHFPEESPAVNNGQLLFGVGGVVLLGIFLSWIGTDGVKQAEAFLQGHLN